jgi:hypothetical protein
LVVGSVVARDMVGVGWRNTAGVGGQIVVEVT